MSNTKKKQVKEVKNWEFECKGDLLKNLCKHAGKFTDEIPLEVDNKGVKLCAVDPAHVAMLEMFVPRQGFQTGYSAVNKDLVYKVAEPFTIGVDVERLNKTAKLMSDNDKVHSWVEGNTWFFKTDDLFKKLVLIGPPLKPKVPGIEFSVKADVWNNKISKLLKAIDETVEYVALEAKNNVLKAVIYDDEDTLDIILSKDVKGEGKAMYSGDYLSKLLTGIGNGFMQRIIFEFSEDKPLKITGEDYYYLLAPRIESE